MLMKSTSATPAEIRKRFEDAGFSITVGSAEAGPIEVQKYGCTHRIERNSQGIWAPSTPPRYLVNGIPCELEDRGYQKFWLAEGRSFPVRVSELKALQSFDQEVRYVLSLKSLYNESLGSTSARSAYDRVEGRPDA